MIRYHPGGFIPTSPAENMAVCCTVADGYTEWDEAGTVLVQRSLTADETAAETPSPSPKSDSQKLAEAAAALTALNGIDAPIIAADLFDILTDVRSALEA